MSVRESTPNIFAIALAVLLIALPQSGLAQKTYEACYVPDVGAVYRIGESGLPIDCLEAGHVRFSWADENHPVSNLQGLPVRAGNPGHMQVLAWNSGYSQWEPTHFRFYQTYSEPVIVDNNEYEWLYAWCEEDDQLMSGGFYNPFRGVLVSASLPLRPIRSGPYSWGVLLYNDTGISIELSDGEGAYAWCLDLTL